MVQQNNESNPGKKDIYPYIGHTKWCNGEGCSVPLLPQIPVLRFADGTYGDLVTNQQTISDFVPMLQKEYDERTNHHSFWNNKPFLVGVRSLPVDRLTGTKKGLLTVEKLLLEKEGIQTLLDFYRALGGGVRSAGTPGLMTPVITLFPRHWWLGRLVTTEPLAWLLGDQTVYELTEADTMKEVSCGKGKGDLSRVGSSGTFANPKQPFVFVSSGDGDKKPNTEQVYSSPYTGYFFLNKKKHSFQKTTQSRFFYGDCWAEMAYYFRKYGASYEVFPDGKDAVVGGRLLRGNEKEEPMYSVLNPPIIDQRKVPFSIQLVHPYEERPMTVFSFYDHFEEIQAFFPNYDYGIFNLNIFSGFNDHHVEQIRAEFGPMWHRALSGSAAIEPMIQRHYQHMRDLAYKLPDKTLGRLPDPFDGYLGSGTQYDDYDSFIDPLRTEQKALSKKMLREWGLDPEMLEKKNGGGRDTLWDSKAG